MNEDARGWKYFRGKRDEDLSSPRPSRPHVFDGACTSLTVPSIDGMYGLMAQHEDIVLAVVPGKLTLRDADGVEQIAAVSEGVLKMEHGEALVLVDTIERPEEIDLHRAEEMAADSGRRAELAPHRAQRAGAGHRPRHHRPDKVTNRARKIQRFSTFVAEKFTTSMCRSRNKWRDGRLSRTSARTTQGAKMESGKRDEDLSLRRLLTRAIVFTHSFLCSPVEKMEHGRSCWWTRSAAGEIDLQMAAEARAEPSPARNPRQSDGK